MQNLDQGYTIGNRYEIVSLIESFSGYQSYVANLIGEQNFRVIVHLLLESDDERALVTRLRNEFSTLSRLRHPNLSLVLDMGLLPDSVTPFLVEEFVEGRDLLGASADWSVDQSVEVVAKLCRVLHYLHCRDITHRDIDPAKILFPPDRRDGAGLKLMNIALSRALPWSYRSAGVKPLFYKAPEVLLGRPPNVKSDLYSLGIILYRLLSKRLPFEDDDAGFLIQKQLQGRVDLRAVERIEHGPGLAQVVRGLLEKEPAKRPSSAEEVLRLLGAATGRDLSGNLSVPVEGYFLASRFVGRSVEMEFLQHRARRVRESGRGVTIYLSGDAGIGKSRLMEEFRIWALSEGWRVIEASCRGTDDKSYAPFREILDKTKQVTRTKSGLLKSRESFSFDALPQVPEASLLEVSSEPAAGRFRDLLTREIVSRLADRPTLVLIHDFHWAGQASVAVLDYLSADIQVHPVLVCVSLRRGDTDSAHLRRLIEQSADQMRSETMSLDPLSQDSVKELIECIIGDPGVAQDITAWAYETCGGNPFFLEEILKHLVDHGLLERESAGWRFDREKIGTLEVPATVAKVLRHRFSQLSRKAQDLAGWLAVYGHPMPEILLRELRAPVEISAGSLSELISRQMVKSGTIQGETCFEFSHGLIAEVIRADMSPRKRRGIHARIGEVLERRGAAKEEVQEIALHLTEARMGEKATRYALKAAVAFKAEFANESALKYFEYVLRHPEGLSSEELCYAATDTADVLCALGKAKKAVKILKRFANSNFDRHLNLLGVHLHLKLSQSFQFLGDLRQTHLAATKGLILLQRSPEQNNSEWIVSLRVRLLSQLAFCALNRSEPQRGLDLLNEALGTLSQSRENVLRGSIYTLSSALHRVACDIRGGIRAGETALRILEPLKAYHILPVAYSNLGSNLTALGRFKRALEMHQSAVEASEQSRSMILRSQAISNIAECQCRLGHIGTAKELSERAIKLVAESGNQLILHQSTAILTEIQIILGDYVAAHSNLKTISSMVNARVAVYSRAHVHFLHAWLSTELGDWTWAVENIEQLARLASDQAPVYEAELAEILRARILIYHGKAEQALNLLTSLEGRLLVKKWPYQICVAKIWQAEALIDLRRWSEATRFARRAFRLSCAMPSNHLKAHASLLLGRALYLNWRSKNADLLAHSVTAECDELHGPIVASSHLLRALELAEQAGAAEINWRASLELAKLEESQNNTSSSFQYAKKALEVLAVLEKRVPPGMVEPFWKGSCRALGKKDCETILQRGTTERDDAINYEDLEIEHIRTLYRASQVINRIKELHSLVEAILDLLIGATRVERAFLFLIDESSKKTEFVRGRRIKHEPIGAPDPLCIDIVEMVHQQGRPLVSANVRSDPRLSRGRDSAYKVDGTVLCAPLKLDSKTLGVLYADRGHAEDYVDESTINLFAAFCNLSALAVDNALSRRNLLEERNDLENQLLRFRSGSSEIIGSSEVVEGLIQRIAMAAKSPLDILITGESGTGKELVARALHRAGRRSDGKFVALDCGSIADNLVESELFGVRKGAFTGATENRPGLIESANGGILFLDEISNLSYRLQGKLLRVTQEKEIRRLGETMPRKVDVQIIAATNRNLIKEIRKGRFRSDLYYRLTALEIPVPPLRERTGDIPLLIQWFLQRTAEAEGGKVKIMSSGAHEILCRYSFPGNVRQLKNLVQGCYYLAPGRMIHPEHLPREIFEAGEDQRLVSEGRSAAESIYTKITAGGGTFVDLVKTPFMKRELSSVTVRNVIRLALKATDGRYREAFRRLKISDGDYSVMMLFLKRHGCWVDYRRYRRPGGSKG